MNNQYDGPTKCDFCDWRVGHHCLRCDDEPKAKDAKAYIRRCGYGPRWEPVAEKMITIEVPTHAGFITTVDTAAEWLVWWDGYLLASGWHEDFLKTDRARDEIRRLRQEAFKSASEEVKQEKAAEGAVLAYMIDEGPDLCHQCSRVLLGTWCPECGETAAPWPDYRMEI